MCYLTNPARATNQELDDHPVRRTVAWCLALVFVAFALRGSTVFAQSTQPVRACRSVHLWWSNSEVKTPESVAFYNELRVDQSTAGSYFMACGFSKGYFGIQELGNGKKLALFSIWEPGKQNNPNVTPEERRVKTVAHGEGVRVKRFGGEGTGGQSFYDYEWKLGETVRFVVFARSDGPARTLYAGYVYLPDAHRWQHMATFSTLSNGHLLRGYYSFVEDFLRNGTSATIEHRASFGNGWVLTKPDDNTPGNWVPLDRGRFTADKTPTENIDSGIQGDRIYLQTGGQTQNGGTPLKESTTLAGSERHPPIDLPKPFSSKDETRAAAVRVLAYNIKHGRGNDGRVDLDRIASVIRRLNADVVALQEVDHTCDRSGGVDEATELAKKTGLRHSEFGSFFDFQGGQYGMAIISRYPIRDTINLRLPEGAEPRTSLIATIEAPRPFRLANVHFYATEQQRNAQASTLLAHLNEKTQVPCVVAGDFNSRPASSVLKQFDEWKIPSKGDDHFTFSSDKPRVEIDFLMYRPESAFKVNRIEVVDEPVASDHRPLFLDLRW